MADASNIITYIGVPLAVLGVLPIFYTFLNSFFTLRNIKRSLRKSGLEATTRGSFMAGVIEVSVPRFTITPLDRKEDEYWTQGRRPSPLKGGTWTTFNWNHLITSHAMQRVQYSSDLKVPQAEIDLEELFEYLLDRGAVPDAKGIHMLRVSGLWTPTGTSLMLSPDGTQTALRISMPDDSDGVLSLALQWKPEWNKRDRSSLPPGWMRLHFPAAKPSSSNEKAFSPTVERAAEPDRISPTKTDDHDSVPLEKSDSQPKPKPSCSDDSRDGEEKIPSYTPAPTSVRFHLCSTSTRPYIRIASPLYEHNNHPLRPAPPPSLPSTIPPSSSSSTPWLAPLALTLTLSTPSPTTFLTLPPFLNSLSHPRTSSLPSALLVLLSLLSPHDAPDWETPIILPAPEDHLETHQRFMSAQRARAAEAGMAKEERERRERERRREEIEGMARRAVREGRERRDREGRREMEAVKSQRFEIEVVARAAMGFLISEGLLVVDDVDGAAGGDDAGKGAKDIHRTALERLLVSLYSTHVVGIDSPANNNNNNEWALDVCRMLDRWREWGERGGMNIEDLRAVLEEKTAFCWAAVAVGVVARVCEREKGEGGGVLGDVRECLGVWKMVRLG